MLIIKRILREKEEGSFLVAAALFIVLLLPILAFSIDLGYKFLKEQRLQRAADSAVLAGARLVRSGPGAIKAAVVAQAKSTGHEILDIDKEVIVQFEYDADSNVIGCTVGAVVFDQFEPYFLPINVWGNDISIMSRMAVAYADGEWSDDYLDKENPLPVFGYAIFNDGGDLEFTNETLVTIDGNLKTEGGGSIDINNTDIDIDGDLHADGQIDINGANTNGTLDGDLSAGGGINDGGLQTSGSSTVEGQDDLQMPTIDLPTGVDDPNWVHPITIIPGDFTIPGNYALTGTLYVQGTLYIENCAGDVTITGSGSICTPNDIHFRNANNITVGALPDDYIFFYAGGDMHFNAVNNFTLYGQLYMPDGYPHFNNMGTMNITGGIYCDYNPKIKFNNIDTLNIAYAPPPKDNTPAELETPREPDFYRIRLVK